MKIPHLKTPDVVAGASLLCCVIAVYGQTIGFEYLSWDDNIYITDNPNVLAGLTRENVAWAFTTFSLSNWHPLTWLSLMLDIEWFGPEPGAAHAVNIVLHAANTLMLFAFFRWVTGDCWRSFVLAALFALHPLHVESVAWISERKDLLSTFFWVLTMLLYAAYTRRPRIAWYLALATSFALGLMAKPMLVTLPMVLLLLDVWPLRRISWTAPNASLAHHPARLVLEKLPLLLLSGVSAVLTLYAQQSGATLISIDALSLGERSANALNSCSEKVSS